MTTCLVGKSAKGARQRGSGTGTSRAAELRLGEFNLDAVRHAVAIRVGSHDMFELMDPDRLGAHDLAVLESHELSLFKCVNVNTPLTVRVLNTATSAVPRST